MRGGSLPAGTGTPPGSAVEALHAEEVRRTRGFLRVSWVFALAVLAALPVLPGDQRIAYGLAVAVALGLAGSVWMYGWLADPTRYSPLKMSALAILAVVCGQLGILYTGAFSAAPLAVVLGLYFFCRTEHVGLAIAIYALAAGGHGIEVILVVSGVIDDPGFYPINPEASIEAQIAGQANLQFAYALVFWLARITRKSSLRSIEQLQRAVRLAAQRDVQVAELRRDLARALEVGGPGRFTDHQMGAWKLGMVIGRGSMGEVYEATHATTGEQGAVKLLRRELLGDPRALERFLREVRVAKAISSRHVVRVIEAEPGGAGGLPYLVMERLHGETLHEILRRGGTLETGELARLVEQVAGVLEQARGAGIVHRDIKPQNLFRDDTGDWKILDFGIALLDDSSGTLTRGGVIGTPAYMAPEQARGEPVDHRADLYALAAVMYRCITGRAPFVKADTPAVLYAVAHELPLRPSWVTKRILPAIEHVLALGMAKSREKRFSTAAELASAFAAARRDELAPELVERASELPWSEPERAPA
jgi:serine/threonine-protein kinase